MYPMTVGMPTDKIMPQKTRRLVMIREIENRGKSEQMMPIAVLAALKKS